METLGKRISKVRGDLKLHEFAEKLSSSGFAFEKGALSKYENGKVNPSYNFFVAVKLIFKINLNWLLTGSGSMYSINEHEKTEELLNNLKEELELKNQQLQTIKETLGAKIVTKLNKPKTPDVVVEFKKGKNVNKNSHPR